MSSLVGSHTPPPRAGPSARSPDVAGRRSRAGPLGRARRSVASPRRRAGPSPGRSPTYRRAGSPTSRAGPSPLVLARGRAGAPARPVARPTSPDLAATSPANGRSAARLGNPSARPVTATTEPPRHLRSHMCWSPVGRSPTSPAGRRARSPARCSPVADLAADHPQGSELGHRPYVAPKNDPNGLGRSTHRPFGPRTGVRGQAGVQRGRGSRGL